MAAPVGTAEHHGTCCSLKAFRKRCPDGEEVQHFVNPCNKEYFYIPSPLWLCCEAWMSCVPASAGCCNPLDSVAERALCRGCGHVSALPGAGLISGCHRARGSQLCPLVLVELCWAPEQEPVKLQLLKTPSAVTCSAQLLVGRFTLLFSSLGKEDRFCLSVLLLHVQRCFPACAQPFL